MAALRDGRQVGDFVDDRTDEGIFRIDREIYTHQELFEAELEVFHERNWVFLCHESQIKNADDYFSTYIGRQPVVVCRLGDGSLNAFINACAHRAAMLVTRKAGNTKNFVCAFHGWGYSPDGKCIHIRNEDQGGLPPGVDWREHHSLTTLPRIESYRGFVFGALVDTVPDLSDHLAGAARFIDMFADQSPDGLEVTPGSSSYICQHNWKMQVENTTDGYHAPVLHRNFATTMLHREKERDLPVLAMTETGRLKGEGENGCYDFGRGHNAIWTDRSSPESTPLAPMAEIVEKHVGKPLSDWMIRRGRNLGIFPNMVLNDLASTHLRYFRPLSPDRTEVTIWCIAPVGEPREARSARLRKFEDFFLVSGMATPDDLVNLNSAHSGGEGSLARWTNFLRGLETVQEGPDDYARELGIEPVTSNSSWDHETPYIGFYRYWRDELTKYFDDRSLRHREAAE